MIGQDHDDTDQWADRDGTVRRVEPAAEQPAIEHPALGPWANGCTNVPPGYRVPTGYEVQADAIFFLKVVVRNEIQQIQRVRVAYGPILPVIVYFDPTGERWVSLAWRDRDSWLERVVSLGAIRNGKTLVATLGAHGLPVVDGAAKSVERWLAETLAVNAHTVPRLPLARWLGWQPDGAFVASALDGTRVEPTYPEQAGALAAHRRAGTLEAWQAVMGRLKPYPAAQIVLYAALAAPLLDVLHVDSFTVDVSGRSTRGKTTAARIGLSAWADPSEKGDTLFSWRTTMLAVEKRLNLVRGLPVVLDETRVVKTAELVDQVVYQVPKNHGQARGGGWPSLIPWSTVVISTGEQPISSFTTHQGASARVLTLAEPPFGTGAMNNGATAAELGAVIDEHHGHAGPLFVEQLVTLLSRDGGRDELRQRHAELTELRRGDTDMSGRRAPMVALVMLAAELAIRWGIVPLDPLAADQWALLGGDDPADDRPQMALDVLREWIVAHQSALWRPPSADVWPQAEPSGGWIGRHLTGSDGRPTVAVLPQRAREALQRAKYELDAVLPAWEEHGVILVSRDAEGKRRTTVRQLGAGKSRVLILAPGTVLADRGAVDE